MRIQEIMSEPPMTCSSNESVNAAARLMWEHDCGVVPIVDDDYRVVGIVTDRDICMAAYTQGRRLVDIPVTAAMSKEVFSCRPGDGVDAAERLMQEKQVRRLPVVDDLGRVIGVLSLNDVALAARPVRSARGAEHELASTLAAVCQPRRPEVAPAH
jgi:CBS domain-containing protein